MSTEGHKHRYCHRERHTRAQGGTKMTKRETERHSDTQTKKGIGTGTERHIHRC